MAVFGRGRRAAVLAAGVLVWATAGSVAMAVPAGAVTCPEPTPPFATDHLYFTSYRKTLNVTAPGLLQGDTGTNLTVDVADTDTESFNFGTVVAHAGGSFSYTPDPNYSGEDTFQYYIQDDCGDTDNNTVTIEVLPVMGADKYKAVENKTLVVNAPGVSGNDLGTDGSVFEWDATSAHNGIVNGNDDGSFTYTPARNFVGTDTFKYGAYDLDEDNELFATVTISVSAPLATKPPAAIPSGYWMVEQTGRVHAFGQVKNYGNAPSSTVTHFEPTPTHRGYWIVNASGHVFAFGDAKSYGNANPAVFGPGETVASISATATGKGYWLFTTAGRALPFGDAHFYGDMSHVHLNGPVVGSIGTPTGHGYYMVASDGGIFTFGDATFRGSMGGHRLDKPVEGLVPTSTNRGYWLVASDGGIFAFGDATFRGSMGGQHLNKPVVGMVRYGTGYLMVGSDGGIFDFSNLPFLGSLGGNPPASPIVSVAA